eukprot:gi/632949933/ref/XP_007890433.1/ PREDICTED: helicase with zinc finger domain 2-like [Callorhinchus milii]
MMSLIDEKRTDLILDAVLHKIFENEAHSLQEKDCAQNIFHNVSEEGMVELACYERVTDKNAHEFSCIMKYEEHSPEELNSMLRKEPKTYKSCQLWLKSHECGKACPVDGTVDDIAVNGRINCGTAFPGEEVVVRITKKHEDDLYGKVIGVTKREIGKLKNIICYIDSDDCNLMIPVNMRYKIKIHNPTKKDQPKNCVCVWDVNLSNSTPIVRFKYVQTRSTGNNLFVVQCLKWLPQCDYPLGIVTREILPGNSKQNGMNILQIQYELNGNIFSCTESLQQPSQKGRKDYTRDCVFTIDDKGSKDIDDAISVRELDGKYEIGIHIADVSAFLQKDGDVDVEAKNRATSFYSPCHKGEPIHMLQAAELLAQSPKILNATSFEGCMNIVVSFADRLREERLKEGWHLVSLFNTIHDEHRPRGMIEELMILANRTVAEILLRNETTKTLTPLCIQPKPKSSKLSAFQNVVKPILPISPYLRSCIEHTMSGGKHPLCSTSLKEVFILEPVWRKLIEFQQCHHYDKMKTLLFCEKLHPQLAAAQESEKFFWNTAYMVRAGLIRPDTNHHFSLRVNAYTRFTSPIRRYMDIVVHRLLESVVLNKSEAPYTTEEIDDICRHFNLKTEDSKKYSSRTKQLEEAEELQKNPRQQLAVLFKIQKGKSSLSVLFPDQQFEKMNSLPLKLTVLGLDEQAQFKDGSLTLKWQRKIFCPNKSEIFPSGDTVMDTTGHTISVQAKTWIALQKAICIGDHQTVRELLDKENCSQKCLRSHKLVSKQPEKDTNDYQLLSMTIKNGSVLKMQRAPNLHCGFLKPNIQVVYLNKQVDICIEHARDPELCFTKTDCGEVKGANFINIKDYIERWIPIIEIEAAVNSVMQNDPMVFLNVETYWVEGSPSSGSFKIDSSYTDIDKLEKVITAGDLVCIRHSYAMNESNHKSTLLVDINPNETTWVAHCVITASEKIPPYLEVTFQLHHCASEAPPHVYVSNQPSTIEIMSQRMEDRRKIEAIKSLEKNENLARRIALGKVTPNLDIEQPTGHQINSCEKGLLKLNKTQSNAVRTAMNSEFTVIQAPPGTGKNTAGAYIILNYLKRNKPCGIQLTQSKQVLKCSRQILYCGPSNKSVDVMAEQLLEAKCDLSILRVYDERIEQLAFPLEDVLISKEANSNAYIKENLKCIALHFKIRQSRTDSAEQINQLYQQLKKNDYTSPEERKVAYMKYNQLVHEAQVNEIKNHNIILCTCTTAARPLIKENTNFFQCIVDDSEACTEPECLIPIVSSNAKQVVLIGDHKQSRPDVKSELAKNLGLGMSIFERYVSDALMLNVQYQMHPEICTFLSEEFYHGKLKTAELDKWKPAPRKDPLGKDCLIMFHQAEHSCVTFEEGNRASWSNSAEGANAVKWALDLIHKGVKERDIGIITPYQAQVRKLKQILKKNKLNNIKVLPILHSKGYKWDYVILSTVRSLPFSEIENRPSKSWLQNNLGSLTDSYQLNAVLTKAKNGLCIIGNQNLLRCHPQWKRLLEYYETRILSAKLKRQYFQLPVHFNRTKFV